MWLFQPICPVFWLPYWPPNSAETGNGLWKNLGEDQQTAMPLRNFKIRLGSFCQCHNVGVYCKQFALQVSTDEIHNDKSTQNLVGLTVYFQTFLIFIQRYNYHWTCFRSMRKKLHHKFKNKYIMTQNVIDCWLKCKNPYWIWRMRKCSFSRANVSSLCIVFLKQAKEYQYLKKKKHLCNNKSIKKNGTLCACH